MGVYKTYFDKNNTITRGSLVNTGNNPVAELSYGSRVTRFLFNIDLTALKAKVANKEIVLGPGTKHVVKMKSSLDFSVNPTLDEFHQIQLDGSYRPTSFDLELKPLNQPWDEGNGYDFFLNTTRRPEDVDYIQGPSNWTQATTLHDWAVPGAVVSGTTAVATQHFDKGNEDLEMDITTYVNDLLTATGATQINLCLKYVDGLENLYESREYTTGFFTRHTQTFFEPHVETIFDDVIKDDRQKMFLNKLCRLYLYSNVGGKLTNLDELPVCSIANVTGLTVTQQLTGVYYVEFTPDTSTFTTYKKYYDTWSNLKVGGKSLSNVRMDFIVKDESEFYQLNDEMVLPQRYGVSLSGIKQEEKITTGDKRRVNVLVRKPYTVNQNEIIDDIYYRLYVKIGPAQLTVVDWSDVSRSNLYNFLTLDTEWMVPNKYYVDIMVKQNGETLLYNEQLVFNIVSRKKL